MNQSLFNVAGSPLGDAVSWFTGTILGSVAVSICVLAIAALGLAMLGGWLPVRRGAVVVLGCCVLLGAPLIAAGIAESWHADASAISTAYMAEPQTRERTPLPASDYDPYAGASIRHD